MDDLCAEFRNHEQECRRMAASTKDPRTKSTWNEMADRWSRAAENHREAEKQALLLRTRERRHQPRPHTWFADDHLPIG
jgi:hypothetical protein